MGIFKDHKTDEEWCSQSLENENVTSGEYYYNVI